MFKFFWLIRDRNFWRDRSLSLESKLEKETERNRRFEREMVSRWMTFMNQPGIAQPDLPKQPAKPVEIPKQPTENILSGLSPQQLEDWEMYLADAKANNIGEGQAWLDFWNREVLGQQTIQDDAPSN